jgi:predicted amidohydrolase YtcJ
MAISNITSLSTSASSRRIITRAALWAGCATLGAGTAVAAPPADYVFTNGAIYTASDTQPWAEAVAVKGNHIVYVGSAKGVAEHIGKATRTIDLAGGMLLPGLIDAHSHTTNFSSVLDADLVDRTAPPSGIVERLRKFVEAHPNEKLVRGRGWIYQTFGEAGPTKAMIDDIVPDRPAFLRSIDGHLLWVNSKTLELAGITADTPDPEPGVSWFQRLPGSREPSGFVVEGAAMRVISDALSKHGYELESTDRLAEGYRQGLPIMSAAGVTTIFDAGMPNEPATYDVLSKLEKQGKLGVRIFGSHRYYADQPGAEKLDPVARFLELRKKYHSDLLSVAQIKVAIDGSEDNHTAYMPMPTSPSFAASRCFRRSG